MSSQNPLEEYLENYIKSIPLIFKKLDVTDEQINQVTSKIKSEIIGNPHYLLTIEEQKELVERKECYRKILQEIKDGE
jgi:hypothetical protein